MNREEPAPAISVAVCTRDRPGRVAACIDSILQSPLADMELLVVDQSADEETECVARARRDPRLRYLRTPSRGLSRARNLAVEASRAAIVLFTDDDCRVEPTWAERFLAEFSGDPSVDAVYGRVLPYGSGTPGLVCYSVMRSTEARVVQGIGWERLQDAVGHGNSMAFRRSCFVRHGLFLEWLGAGSPLTGGEDTEFALRILRRGARIRYSPEPLAYHDNWMTVADSNRQLYGYKRSASVVLTRSILRGSVTAARILAHDVVTAARFGWQRGRRSDRAGVAHAAILLRELVVGGAIGALFVARRPPGYVEGQRSRE